MRRSARPLAGRGILLLFLLWLIALNLRSLTIGVAPVLALIRDDLRISFAEAGVLFSLPVVFMGLFAAPGGRLADRLGSGGAVTVSYALLIAGGALRALADSYWSLLLLTAVFSVGIGLAQPSLARLVREHFPERRGTATGVYTTGFISGGILAASATGPLLLWLGAYSWRGTCLVWAALGVVGILTWLVLGPRGGGQVAAPPVSARHDAAAPAERPYSIWRDRTAWLITLFFLAQGIMFYTVSGWLPTYYLELGMPLERAGEPLALFNLAMLPMALSIAYLSDRLGRRRPFLLLGSGLFLAGQVGLIVLPLQAMWLWTVLMGVAAATVFAIALVLPIDLTDHRRAAATVSLMLTIGYGCILLGPLLLGVLRDATGSFAVAWLPNALIGVSMLALGLLLPETGRGLGAERPAQRAPGIAGDC